MPSPNFTVPISLRSSINTASLSSIVSTEVAEPARQLRSFEASSDPLSIEEVVPVGTVEEEQHPQVAERNVSLSRLRHHVPECRMQPHIVPHDVPSVDESLLRS